MTEFAALRRTVDPLVPPNAWGVASARYPVQAGVPALGTTSVVGLTMPEAGRSARGHATSIRCEKRQVPYGNALFLPGQQTGPPWQT